MSPCLFNLFADGLVREVNARVSERGVVMRVDGMRFELNQLLFADDAVLMADSEELLQLLVSMFGVVCERRKMKVNVKKSKVMWCNPFGRKGISVRLNGELLEEVDCFRYLGIEVAANGRMEEELAHRVSEGMKVFGALKSIWKGRNVSIEAKVGMFESIVAPTVLYGCETWMLNARERQRVNVMEMKCLRSICNVRRIDRVRNEIVRRRCGNKLSLLERADRGILRWFGHLERMSVERIVKKVYKSKVDGVRRVGRPRRRWLDGVKDVLLGRGQSVQEAVHLARDRNEWRAFVRGRRAV